ncbi:Calx-beta domain-containing protein, partial [Microcystis aeruginosa]|uniref:Calx-beta domain-containing protein n=1 Tax=Microcystis aeruginosa TaxID=1126 RepID=UPI00265D3B70
MTSTLLPIFPPIDDVLFDFAQSDGFWANLETAFGTSYDVVKATELRQQWQSRNFSQIPEIEVVNSSVLGSANGAYGISTNKIYLSESFFASASLDALVAVILEEIGHYVDAQINQVDSAGDEGAIFAELVQGDALSDSQLALLRVENDWATMIIDGQLTAIEQSNPAPILVASYQGLRNARDVRVIGNYAYLADWSLSTADFKIINISTPTAPAFVSQSNATDIISDVDFLNGYVYAADGTSGLRVIDVSNPSSPSLKSTYNSPGDAQDVKIVGNYAYVADGKSGLQIVNISNPNSPVIQGNAPAPDDVTGVKGNVTGVDILGNYAYIISYLRESGRGELQIFNISNPASPVRLSTFPISTNDLLYSVQVAGNYAYVAAGSRGLKIIDISNPISPTLKGEYFGSSSASAEDVQVVGNYAYVAYGVAGLDIIDISNPSSPILAASYAPVTEAYGPFGIVQKVTNYVTSVEVVNNYAYLTVQAAKDLGGLWILDVNQFTGTNQPPSVGLAVSPASVTEDGTTNLVYTFTRSGSTTNALTVNYTLGGTATLNTDYTRTGTTNTVTFAAGSATATVTIDPTADTTVESDETVALTLASGTGYTVGTTTAVTGTITNDDVTLPNITLAVSPASVTEDGTSNLVYTFTRNGVTTNPLTVNYTLGGTATLNTDYTRTGTTNTVTFAANSSTATITVDPTADTTVESDETVILTLASGTGYTVGTTTAVTGTIKNDDVTLPSITLAVSPSSVNEDGT